MKIGGLQKLTLLDFPDVMACIVFTDGCNFRCPFCHNAPLVTGEGGFPEESESDIFAFLEKRKGLLDGVVVTGGEPLLQPDIDDFLSRVRALGYKTKLDTNGSNPQALERVIGAGLVDYVAMDFKNAPSRYNETAGTIADMGAILRSVELLKSGAVAYEFRTTIVRPLFDEQCFREIGQILSGAKKYFLQSFKDSGDLVNGEGLSAYSHAEAEGFLKIVREYVPAAELR